MGTRINKVVTRTGDQGYTTLSDGKPLCKDAARLHCIGDIDELNSLIGLLACDLPADTAELLLQIQHDLFDLGGELSLVDKNLLNEDHLERLDSAIERLSATLRPLKEFILPGGSRDIAQAHVARTVCRRAERGLAGLTRDETVNPVSLKYLNRLSDLLFVLARQLAAQSGQAETYWQSAYSRIKRD